jgi:anaerobic ribonucleoside-triphosphate reductase
MRIQIGVCKKCGHAVITKDDGLYCIKCGKSHPLNMDLLNAEFDVDKPDIDS